jgi:hypothetical protein
VGRVSEIVTEVPSLTQIVANAMAARDTNDKENTTARTIFTWIPPLVEQVAQPGHSKDMTPNATRSFFGNLSTHAAPRLAVQRTRETEF